MPASPTAAGADPPAAGPVRGCPGCGGALVPWRTVPTSDPSLPGTFALLRCPACGTAVTAGVAPAFDAAHDGGSYATRRPRGARLAAPLLAAFDRQRLRLLARHGARPRTGVPAPRLLDVGAGRGRFVAAARRAGWDAGGLEPAARGVEAARDVYGVELRQADVTHAPAPEDGVDAITLWHVLEHLEEPGAALERLAGWLRPGGVLLIGVPNGRALQARVGGDRWFHRDVPRHRTHYTEDGLRRAVAAAGLRTEAVHGVLLEHNPFGMWQSVVNRLSGTSSYLYYLLKRAAPLRPLPLVATVACVPLLPVLAALEAAAGARGRGGTMALVARRVG